MADIVANYGKKDEVLKLVVEITPHIRSIQKSLQESGIIGKSEFLSITMCPDGYLSANIGESGWHIQKFEGEETERFMYMYEESREITA